MDATRRRLGWTAIADLSPVTLEAVVRTEDRGSTLKPFVHALALEAVAVLIPPPAA